MRCHHFAKQLPALGILGVIGLGLAGCASPPSSTDAQWRLSQDRLQAEQSSPPVEGTLTLAAAIDRALRLNLAQKARQVQAALASGQVDLAELEMLPTLTTRTSGSDRRNDRVTRSVDLATGLPAPGRFISQDREHVVQELSLSWNLIDFGLGYLNTRQAQARLAMTEQRNRKAAHQLAQDVRVAYWRAASAQMLLPKIERAIAQAERALSDSQLLAQSRLRNPQDVLRYQKQLLENLRLLEALASDFEQAQVDLAHLIQHPLGSALTLVLPERSRVDQALLDAPIGELEREAIAQHPDLREQLAASDMAEIEAHKVWARLFPNVRLSVGDFRDSDRFQVNPRWQESSWQISWNLVHLFTLQTQERFAKAGIAAADQRRIATQMAVIAQVHVARVMLLASQRQLERAESIWQTDQRLADIARLRENAGSLSALERVSSDVAAILSEARRYQSLAQHQAAMGKLVFSLGRDTQPELALAPRATLIAHQHPSAGQ